MVWTAPSSSTAAVSKCRWETTGSTLQCVRPYSSPSCLRRCRGAGLLPAWAEHRWAVAPLETLRLVLLEGGTLCEVDPAVSQRHFDAAGLGDGAVTPPCSHPWRPVQHCHHADRHERRQAYVATDAHRLLDRGPAVSTVKRLLAHVQVCTGLPLPPHTTTV